MDQTNFDEKFAICGPSIRLIFDVESIDATRELIDAAVRACPDFDQIHSLVLGESEVSRDRGASSTLFRSSFLPPMMKDGMQYCSLAHGNVEWDFASQYVIQALINKNKHKKI